MSRLQVLVFACIPFEPKWGPLFLLEKAFVGWGWPPKIEVIWVLGIYQIFPPNESGFISIPASNMSGHLTEGLPWESAGDVTNFTFGRMATWNSQKEWALYNQPKQGNIYWWMNIIYIHTYIYIYHLENGWRNSHVLVCHGPLQIATFWEWLAIYFHYGVHHTYIYPVIWKILGLFSSPISREIDHP